MSVVYDTAVFVGADRSDRTVWADHRIRLEMGAVPTTTAPVVAQVSRSPRQVQLRRFLRGCEIVAFSPEQGHEVGMLLDQAGTSDVVDAHVVVVAARTHSTILTSDLNDFRQLSNHLTTVPPLRRA
jgi:predicted nucleic acid-binding protein